MLNAILYKFVSTSLHMKHFLLSLSFLLLFHNLVRSNVFLPTENSRLNYTLIGFNWPLQPEGTMYTFEIAEGNFTDQKTFEKNIFKKQQTARNKLVMEVPRFNSFYTWRIRFSNNRPSILHHFKSELPDSIKKQLPRLRITKQADSYKNAYVFSDGGKALYNMTGDVVWYLPTQFPYLSNPGLIADLKLTPSGTISLLFKDSQPIEIDYNGNIVWQVSAKKGSVVSSYHHEFTKIDNNRYMILGYEKGYYNQNPLVDTKGPLYFFSMTNDKPDSGLWARHEGTTLEELNSNGEVIWKWSENNYFISEQQNILEVVKTNDKPYDTHPNSFYFDRDNSEIYLSLRNHNTIIKIAYPSGVLLATYGNEYEYSNSNKTPNLFSGQHSISLSKHGDIYIYNNNTLNPQFPEVLQFEKPQTAIQKLKLKWKFETESLLHDKVKNVGYTRGGNVNEIDDKAVFASMNIPFGNVFIVNRSKQVLWSGVFETRAKIEGEWMDQTQYRASIVTSSDLIERLVFSGATLNKKPYGLRPQNTPNNALPKPKG